VRQRVEQMLVGGADENAAADAVDFGEFVGERLPEDRHGMPKRHRATVAKIVAEERAKREKA
jgi:hypothetical protein